MKDWSIGVKTAAGCIVVAVAAVQRTATHAFEATGNKEDAVSEIRQTVQGTLHSSGVVKYATRLPSHHQRRYVHQRGIRLTCALQVDPFQASGRSIEESVLWRRGRCLGFFYRAEPTGDEETRRTFNTVFFQ